MGTSLWYFFEPTENATWVGGFYHSTLSITCGFGMQIFSCSDLAICRQPWRCVYTGVEVCQITFLICLKMTYTVAVRELLL